VAGTREWMMQHTPYFLVYKHVADQILVLRMIHGKRNWPVSR
jgi:plasmid stabilization system protein ParE